MRLRILTNLAALARVQRSDVALELTPYPVDGRVWPKIESFWRSRHADYLLVNCAPSDVVLFGVCKLLLPFAKVRVIALDTVLPVPRPEGLVRALKQWIIRTSFRGVDLFVEYFKQTEGYERHFKIPRVKFRYVPFKINRYEAVLETPTSDLGYIFCGGNTRRDFATLMAAARELPYPFRIVTMDDATVVANGSQLDERNVPPNVEVVRHDGSVSFLQHIAGAKLVALPIRRDNISASGIGVYLASMGLGKCVVISEGPAVNGIVPQGAAVIVPAEDVAALRDAIRRVYEDDVSRSAIAKAGQRYALSLQGEDRLCGSIVDLLVRESKKAGHEAAPTPLSPRPEGAGAGAPQQL